MERKNKKQSFSARISERTAFFLGIVILILGAAFMIFGIWRGEMAVVFEKAVNMHGVYWHWIRKNVQTNGDATEYRSSGLS